jgi:hypothetical protein
MALHNIPITVGKYDSGLFSACVPCDDPEMRRVLSSAVMAKKRLAIANVIGRLQGSIRTNSQLRSLLEGIMEPRRWDQSWYNKWSWHRTKTIEVSLEVDCKKEPLLN